MNETLNDTEWLRGQMNVLIDHLHADGSRAMEPQARVMFHTSADVLSGLVKTFRDYQSKHESVWPGGQPSVRDAEL